MTLPGLVDTLTTMAAVKNRTAIPTISHWRFFMVYTPLFAHRKNGVVLNIQNCLSIP
jgi:hypothetical protein